MEVRRTAPVRLVVPDEYHDDLHETADHVDAPVDVRIIGGTLNGNGYQSTADS